MVLVEQRGNAWLSNFFADAVMDGHRANLAIPDPAGVGAVRDFRALGICGPLQKCQLIVTFLVQVAVTAPADLALQQMRGFTYTGMAMEIPVGRHQHALGIKITGNVGLEIALLGQAQVVVQDLPCRTLDRGQLSLFLETVCRGTRQS